MQATLIDESTIERAKSVDLPALAARYTSLRKESALSHCAPCPKCRGTDRFWIRDNHFHCRNCHEKPGDAIEFVQWIGAAHSFQEAVEMLTGESSALLPARQAVVRPVTPQQTQEWTQSASASVERWHEYLFHSDKAAPGRDYLLRRGLGGHVWLQFKLGYTNAPLPGTEGKERRPAITIPWLRGEKVIGIRYRFLEVHTYIDTNKAERTESKSSMVGSQFSGVLWGGLGLLRTGERQRTLVIVEGEFNAMSVWQVTHDTGVDVLSMGSESQKLTPAMADYVKQFRHVIAWTDRAEVAESLQSSLPGSYGVSSPNGHDANDLLFAGHLGGYLSA